jgi:hypothetical protein
MSAASDIEGVIARLVDKLNLAGLGYMLVGSFASSMHGEPRSTQDIDVVVLPDTAALERFLLLLPDEEYYCDRATARAAMRARSMFNVIELASVWKVDVIIQRGDPHAREAFERRVKGRFGAMELCVESPEDTVVSKLRWAQRSGGSERQLRDVSGILRLAQGTLDLAYIERWVQELNLGAEWTLAQS